MRERAEGRCLGALTVKCSAVCTPNKPMVGVAAQTSRPTTVHRGRPLLAGWALRGHLQCCFSVRVGHQLLQQPSGYGTPQTRLTSILGSRLKKSENYRLPQTKGLRNHLPPLCPLVFEAREFWGIFHLSPKAISLHVFLPLNKQIIKLFTVAL